MLLPSKSLFSWDTYGVCILVLVADELVLGAEVVDGEERYTGVGHTERFRVLVLAWTMRDVANRPITAFDASERLTKRYLAAKGF